MLTWLGISGSALATGQQRGQVTFNDLPVPGATITATQGDKKVSTVSGEDGYYNLSDLAGGVWKIDVAMSFFVTLDQTVSIVPNMPGIKWELRMLPLDQMKIMKSETQVTPSDAPNAEERSTAKPNENEAVKVPNEPAPSNDGLLVNGSVHNAATSQFSLAPSFGNNRSGSKSLYTGGLALVLDNSALDARPYSLNGLNTPKTAYNTVTGVFSLGGPIHIPRLRPRGPDFVLIYNWMRSSAAAVQTGLVPTQAQRGGELPTGNIFPVDPVAQALLALYPLPNTTGSSLYNYQIPVLNSTHQDSLQTRLSKTIGQRDSLDGNFAFQSARANGTNLFRFVDTTDTLGLNSNVDWSHRFNHGVILNIGFRFSRLRTLVRPYFENRTNVAGDAGITGNNQDPTNWGPPTLIFSSGIASLTDEQSAFNRNRTTGISPSVQWFHGHHNFSFGGDFRRQEYNYFSQQNPRGSFVFTGAASGFSDFADFLSGIPDVSAIAFGNADKYLRQSVYDAYATDDWRIRPKLTLNIGVRWEYGAPITELKNRLVNLDVARGFSAVTPVLATDPSGALTGQRYPNSLVRPDRTGIEPRLGLSWRPILASSLVVRAGYGIYYDTSVYQATSLQMAQQAPLSKSLQVQNSAACVLTLANAFSPCASITSTTFAIDPNFRVGYAQAWQLAVQRDLPFAMQLTATYLGIKGTRGVQDFLPNTYPIGEANPCPQCPTGFTYRNSGGDSTREAGSVQLRRRLRSGFTATALYTYSKSIDDDSLLGGQGPIAAGATAPLAAASPQITQNWLDLRAERSLSTFDQRHLINLSAQYSSGEGLGGGTLLSGWRGRLLKEWTFTATIAAGTGLPETPIFLAPTNGTGVTGNIRPSLTGQPIHASTVAGHFLNAAAYTAPTPGQWGTAGRNSITGPGQFTFNTGLARTFRTGKRFNLDLRVDATNILNHAGFTAWNTTINPALSGTTPALGSPLFGLPTSANPMRSLQTTARLRF
jgi:trimeric autotransporter adhesin